MQKRLQLGTFINEDIKTNWLNLLDSVLFDNTGISKHLISHTAVFICIFSIFYTMHFRMNISYKQPSSDTLIIKRLAS
jgi:hypothetical protein